jgi:hypothetical protein
LKWFLFLVISFGIANVFLAYLVGDELIQMIEDGPLTHTSTLDLSIFTGVFYFIFVWFGSKCALLLVLTEEGVLLDNKSINVAYDFVRGERGRSR